MSAILSDCGTYRYALWRDLPVTIERWRPGETCLFVMLNPSTADATEDDPTIRRCVGFARSWGFGRLAVANLFAYRSPFPKSLERVEDPVGPENNDWLKRLSREAAWTIAAWGADRAATKERVADVLGLMASPVRCLGVTKAGHPRHPLYVPGATTPVPFRVESDV